MTTGFNFFLSRVLEPVAPVLGASGYFSAPTESLDTSLFVNGDAEKFRPDVRAWVLRTLYDYWRQKYQSPEEWSTVWIAGSAISYQWSESRGNGDLDVLIGVDWPGFFRHNQRFLGFSEGDMAAIINQEFHAELWPRTAEQELGGRIFEVTFYVNPGSTDIRNINPYAAYDLTHDTWTVRPPTGGDFDHPDEFYKNAHSEVAQAYSLVDRYNAAANQAKAMNPGSPGWHNAMRQAEILVSQASDLYDAIHLGRRQAFSPHGQGYGDYHNFRWQYHKQQGSAQALNAVRGAHKAAQEEYSNARYGGAIDAHDVALRRAAMWNRGGNGR